MSFSPSFSDSYHYNRVADDSSTVFDADTVTPDEVPSSSPPMPPLPPLTTTATTTDYLYNNNESISSTSIQEESPANTISEFLRRFNSTRHHPTVPSTTTAAATATATATRTEEISTNQSSSSSLSSSKKRSIITNSSSHSSRKKTRRSSHLKRQQLQDQSYVDKPDSEVEDENEPEDYEPDEVVINQSSSSQTSTTKLTKQELKWKSKFDELHAHKQLHGHTCVPQSNKELGNWVMKQRHEYKKFQANKKAYITKERIEMLNSIGFEWVSQTTKPRNESAWNKRLNELKAYKEKNGHTDVPQNFKDNKELGKWVSNQRAEYKKLKKNGRSQITPERIQTLESIGFEWVSPNQGHLFQRNESAWNERFNELKAYKEKYGDTNVPRDFKDNKQLGRWVDTQRKEYRKFQAKKKSQITPERIQTLESIGFQWELTSSQTSTTKRQRQNEMKWKSKFQELCAYKQLHGHANVPRSNKQLGIWVLTQRTEYRKLKKNGKGKITPERIQMLNSIGFQWECRPARPPRS